MTENFFTDNPDLQFHLNQLDLSDSLEVLEDDYGYHDQYPTAPRNYADAKDNYRRLLNLLGQVCAEHIAPRAAEADAEAAKFRDGQVTYPAAIQDAVTLLRQADLMGAMLPWEYGGLNLPETIFQMMVEIVSRADASLMSIFGLQEISATIAEYGDEEMKARLLPRFARGEVTGAMVLTEPDAGSDLGAVQTRATYDEEADVWRLNGVKRFITNGCADVLLVLARSEEGSTDARGLSLFVVEDNETVRVRRIEHKMGLRASPTCEIQFRNTPAHLVGRRRYGLIRYTWAMMNGARIAVATQAIGVAEAAYREALQYARERVQFDQPIIEIPAVYRMLLSMRGEIEATRSLAYEAGQWMDLKKAYEHRKEQDELDREGRKALRRISRLVEVLTPLTKYHATEMGNRVCYQAMQVHGGAGYMREFDVERHYRDIRVTSIYEGTSQLQVVAARGGLLGHVLDGLLDDLAGLDYDEELAPLKAQVEEATATLNRCIDHMKGLEDSALVDYYASDMADAAVYVLTCWLMLRDAQRDDEAKREMARVYIAETTPKVHGRAKTILAANQAPLEAKDTLFS